MYLMLEVNVKLVNTVLKVAQVQLHVLQVPITMLEVLLVHLTDYHVLLVNTEMLQVKLMLN